MIYILVQTSYLTADQHFGYQYIRIQISLILVVAFPLFKAGKIKQLMWIIKWVWKCSLRIMSSITYLRTEQNEESECKYTNLILQLTKKKKKNPLL